MPRISHNITVVSVTHDLQKKISYVTLTWDGPSESKLNLPIPFGTKLEELVFEAGKTIRDFAGELVTVTVTLP